MKKTNPETEQHILTQILLGYPYSDISQNTGVAVATIKKIKARNRDRYEAKRGELEHWSAKRAKASLQRVYALLDRYLIEAEENPRKVSVEGLVLIANQMLIHEQVTQLGNDSKPLFKKRQDIENLLSRLKKK